MKCSALVFFLVTSFLVIFKDGAENKAFPVENISYQNNNKNLMDNKLRIKIGTTAFTATLLDSPTAKAFRALLPMTVKMNELNGNEKYFDLQKKLVTNASNPGSIRSGDLMMYGGNTLVLFYKAFSTSYSYTKLGRIDDTSGLAEALGSGNVSITFEPL